MSTCWTGVCVADPIATLLASPCRDNLDLGEALRREVFRHNWIELGWRVDRKGEAYEIAHAAALNKMSEINFTWRLDNNAITATSAPSLALCERH